MYNFDALDKRLKKYVADNMVSGLSIVVMKDNQIVYDKNIGYLDVDKKKPVNKHSLFRIASLTKVITAVAVLICQEQGLLNIDDYIDKYIPYLDGFYLRDDNHISEDKYRITIRELICHSSGFFYEKCPPEHFGEFHNLDQACHIYKDFYLKSIPGDKETYSNQAYDIAARIVEVVSGLSFYDFLKKHIFVPLGMTETKYFLEEADLHNLADLTIYNNGALTKNDSIPYGFDNYDNGFNGGGAGLVTTTHDYMKFANALTNGGEGLISKESFKILTTRYQPKGYRSVFGFGVYVRGIEDWEHLPKGSFGWSGAYGGHYFSIPQEKITVVYLHNSFFFGGAGAEHTLILEDEIVQTGLIEKIKEGENEEW